DVMPEWYRAHPLAELPDITRDHRAHWAHSIEGLTRGWSEEHKQWKPEAHRDHGFYPRIALRLLNYGMRSESELAATALTQVRQAVEKAIADSGPGRIGLDLALHLGHVKENLGGLAGGADALNGQREDGSWPFAPNEQTETLGTAGDTALGICCEPILRLLNVTQRTGDERSLRAALKGLDYVEANFRRPAGGETWEVPLHAPNLRAAALAVECGVTAYELIGDERYLDMARYWARSGLPFIYTWRAGDREAMRFATISVFGATFYTIPWFARPVQWVGLVYSRALQRLAPHDQSLPWGHIAEGIVLSCIQQQHMAELPEAGNPWPGAFPDSYSLLDGKVYGAWIGPQSIIESLEDLLDVPATDFALVGERPGQIRVISAAKIDGASLSGDRLTVALRYPAGRTCHSVLTCIARPARVLADDAEIPEVTDLDPAPAGWWADTTRGYLVIKHPSRAGEIKLAIHGARFAPSPTRGAAGALTNTGFEEGMADWTGEGKIGTDDSHSGRASLRIDGAAARAEQQVYSEVVRVTPDVDHTLEAWVRVLTEKTGYKVTIDWLDADGRHITYDNDWQGADRPTQWSPHGGVFRSPKNASLARLILGAHPGVTILLDDITFAPR
ncbi:MAG: carbohydrate binding domain-containing protein, partial [Armatimonadota bacterium]